MHENIHPLESTDHNAHVIAHEEYLTIRRNRDTLVRRGNALMKLPTFKSAALDKNLDVIEVRLDGEKEGCDLDEGHVYLILQGLEEKPGIPANTSELRSAMQNLFSLEKIKVRIEKKNA